MAGLNIARGIPDHEDVVRVDRLTGVPDPVFGRAPDKLRAVLSVGTKSSKLEVMIQISPLKLNSSTFLDVSRSQAAKNSGMLLEGFQKTQDAGEHPVGPRRANLVREKTNISVKDPIDSVRGMASRTPFVKDFPDNCGVRLAMGSNPFHGILNSQDLVDCTIQRANSGPSRQDQRTVDVKQKQLHAAILPGSGEDELVLALKIEQHGQILRVHFEFESAVSFLADKSMGEYGKQHFALAFTIRASHLEPPVRKELALLMPILSAGREHNFRRESGLNSNDKGEVLATRQGDFRSAYKMLRP